MPELDATEIILRNFHVDDLQGNHKCDMILGLDVLTELKEIYVSRIIKLGEIKAHMKDFLTH